MLRKLLSLTALTIIGLSIYSTTYTADMAEDEIGSFVNEACPAPITEESLMLEEEMAPVMEQPEDMQKAQQEMDAFVKSLPPEEQEEFHSVVKQVEDKMEEQPNIEAEGSMPKKKTDMASMMEEESANDEDEDTTETLDEEE